MMATESPQDRSNEATLTSDSDRVPKIDSTSEDVSSSPLQVNSDDAGSTVTHELGNKQISDVVDDLVNSAEVSISGGSDNEASRSRPKDDEKGHGRTSSTVKKPTTFKSVSVNKTFLASKGAAATGASKAADKPTPGAGLASAQGTASTTTSRPRLVAKSAGSLVAKSSSGANAGKVAQAPDPSVVWNKNRPAPVPEPKKLTDEELKKYGIHISSRLHPDDGKGQANWADIDDDDDDWSPETITWQDGTKVALPHVEEQPSAPPPPPYAPPPAQRDAGAFEKPKSPAPNPSVSPKPGLLASGKGLVLKGAPEKPTLVAKPPSSHNAVRSPWAQIPRVEKASPVMAGATPAQPGAAKYAGIDGPGSKSTTLPPPKEIAADDFNRTTWRDSHGAGNRELYNSQNGRYEPVTDRRASMRSDQHSRQPALLQRTSQSDQRGPAEPSAAFQTSRVSEQTGPYGRRRGSSNVSGGSGSFLRPKGLDQHLPPADLLSMRRESSTAVSDSPVSPTAFSHSSQHGGPRHPNNHAWPSHASPVVAHVTPHHPAPSAEVQGIPVADDQDIIAAQKKLMHERRELAQKRRLEQEAREEAEKNERIRLKLEAMGPAPESRSARMAATKDEKPPASQTQPAQTSPRQSDAADEQKRPEGPSTITKPEGQLDTGANGIPSHPQPQVAPPRDSAESRSQPQGSAHAQPWPSTSGQPDRYQSWSIQSSVKNVWAPPNNDRSLGNGTFNSELGGVAEPAQITPIAGKPGPGPIAPPHASRGTSKPQATVSSAAPTRQPPIGSPMQIPRREADATQRNLLQNAWVSSVRESDAAMDQELRAQHEEDMRKLEAEGRTLADAQAPITDTWRPTKLNEDGRRVSDGPRQRSLQQPRGVPWGTSVEGAAVPVQKSLSATSRAQGSRFFPARDIRYEAGADPESRRHNSPSPPPPDMDGHPAFDGDVARPQVSLPRPHPVVRLPPTPEADSGPTGVPNEAPNFNWAVPTPYREHETGQPISHGVRAVPRGSTHNQGNKWQDKINNLLGGRKGPSPPKSLPVDSASRSSLEHHRYHNTTTISLPSPLPAPTAPSAQDGSVTSKCMAEECFEEQEMGSLPPVRLPNEAPELAWQPCPAPKPLPKKLGATILSIEPLTFPSEVSGGGTVLRVFMPGMSTTKNFTVPFPRTRSNPRRAPRGGRHASQAHRSGKPRDASSSHLNDQGASSSGSAPSRGGRGGGFRGRENWSRNSSTPIQT